MINSNIKIQDAFSCLQRGDLKQAIAISGDIIKSNPLHFDALHIRALAQFHNREIAGALRDIETAISIRLSGQGTP